MPTSSKNKPILERKPYSNLYTAGLHLETRTMDRNSCAPTVVNKNLLQWITTTS